MSVTVKELQGFVEKQVILHLKQDDGSLAEVTGEIKAATEAGVPFKEKGKPTLSLIMVGEIEEVALAPIKPKAVIQKKLKPIELGQARQHLLDRHGVGLQWAKETDEQAAFDYHAGVDHSHLGHRHEVPSKPGEKDETKDSDES